MTGPEDDREVAWLDVIGVRNPCQHAVGDLVHPEPIDRDPLAVPSDAIHVERSDGPGGCKQEHAVVDGCPDICHGAMRVEPLVVAGRSTSTTTASPPMTATSRDGWGVEYRPVRAPATLGAGRWKRPNHDDPADEVTSTSVSGPGPVVLGVKSTRSIPAVGASSSTFTWYAAGKRSDT